MEAEEDSGKFDMYIKEANAVIDTVINNAIEIHKEYLRTNITEEQKCTQEPENSPIKHHKESEISPLKQTNGFEEGNKVARDIRWLTAEEFNTKRGKEQIEEFLKTWERDDSWLYCIDFLGEEQHDCDVRYRYKVMWSIPTRRKPIPRATASVYFTIKVSKYKPKSFPVEVYYVFETNRLVHRPGKSTFQQKWLKDIIDSKIELMSDIRF